MNQKHLYDMWLADQKVYELFTRVLHEGPRADEYYAKDDLSNRRFHKPIATDWRIAGAGEVYAVLGGEYFDDLPWEEEKGVLRATIYPGDLYPDGRKKRIWIGPMFGPGSRGIWVANQYTRGVHHYFGLTGKLFVPGVVEYYGDKPYGEGTERWHIHDTDDEVVTATITYINQRS